MYDPITNLEKKGSTPIIKESVTWNHLERLSHFDDLDDGSNTATTYLWIHKYTFQLSLFQNEISLFVHLL